MLQIAQIGTTEATEVFSVVSKSISFAGLGAKVAGDTFCQSMFKRWNQDTEGRRKQKYRMFSVLNAGCFLFLF